MKRIFSACLLILTGTMALLQSCTPDENPLPGNVDQVIDQLPVMLAETDYNAENTYYLLNDEESPDVFFDPAQRSFNVNNPLQFSMDVFFGPGRRRRPETLRH